MQPVFDQRAYTWRDQRLSGCRLVVKDLFDVAGIPTGAGNPDWLASHPVPETTAPVVQSLLEAGATFVGKTQTDELAYSLNGLNEHYGSPVNPRAPERLAGGSSTGSAVAVAAGEADVGLGSDTGGSIRVPASYNGLFGLRPSHGLITSEGMVPLAPSFDTVGWMTRDATKLSAAGDVLLPLNCPRPVSRRPLTVRVLEPETGSGSLWGEVHEQWLCDQHQLRITDRLTLSSKWLSRASDCFRVLQGRQIWRLHGAWITSQRPAFADDVRERLEWCRTLSDSDEATALADQQALCGEIEGWLSDADILLMPTTPGPAPRLTMDAGSLADYRRQLMGLTAPAGLAGLPQLHLPVLTMEGAPAGVSLMGPCRSDRLLLQLAMELDTGANPESGESS